VQSILLNEHPVRKETVSKSVVQLKMHLHKLANYEKTLRNISQNKSAGGDSLI